MPKPLSAEIVDALQTSIRDHWTQIAMYETQASHFTRWGYPRLGETYAAYAVEEREHAKKVMDRLEFFDVQPSYEIVDPIWPRHDFEGILEVNYSFETTAANDERAGYSLCISQGDAVTAAIFADLLAGSEEGMAHIEAVRLTIDQIGLDNYLANQT